MVILVTKTKPRLSDARHIGPGGRKAGVESKFTLAICISRNNIVQMPDLIALMDKKRFWEMDRLKTIFQQYETVLGWFPTG